MESLTLPTPRPRRVAIVGIGNDLNGDDAAGVRVVRELAARLPATPGVLLIDAGIAPENFSGPLRRFQPNLVLEVDAALLDEAPGTTRAIDWREADGLSASTHTLPPSVLASYLVSELGCEVCLIGIQPARMAPETLDAAGAALSPEVERAVHNLADALCRWITDERRAGL